VKVDEVVVVDVCVTKLEVVSVVLETVLVTVVFVVVLLVKVVVLLVDDDVVVEVSVVVDELDVVDVFVMAKYGVVVLSSVTLSVLLGRMVFVVVNVRVTLGGFVMEVVVLETIVTVVEV